MYRPEVPPFPVLPGISILRGSMAGDRVSVSVDSWWQTAALSSLRTVVSSLEQIVAARKLSKCSVSVLYIRPPAGHRRVGALSIINTETYTTPATRATSRNTVIRSELILYMIYSLHATIVSLFVRTFSTRGKESCTESQRSGVAVWTGEYAVDTTARSVEQPVAVVTSGDGSDHDQANT